MAHSVTADVLDLHVRESNAIEGIGGMYNFLSHRFKDPYVAAKYIEGHRKAAGFVARAPREALLNPTKVHRLLFSELGSRAGEYRVDRFVRVAEKVMPHPRYVEDLMSQWVGVAEWMVSRSSIRPKRACEDAIVLHNMFLCIHPFEDGNGRTARLLYNAARLSLGVPWMVIYNGDYNVYMEQLERFEERDFKRQYPHVYP